MLLDFTQEIAAFGPAVNAFPLLFFDLQMGIDLESVVLFGIMYYCPDLCVILCS
jgi:hypothetical protein